MFPIYIHIEFCRSAEALWGKLHSRRWDWLGVRPDGKFVIGSPPAAPITGRAELEVMRGSISEMRFGVVVHAPEGFAGGTWCSTAEQARREYNFELDRLQATDKPGIYRVRRMGDGEVLEEEFVVPRPPTHL